MPEPDALLTAREVEAMTCGAISTKTLAWWRHKNDGTGPRSFKLGPKKVVYKKSDVQAWLDAQYNATEAS